MSGQAWSGVRWREDVGWELRCEACAHKGRPGGSYWPLTEEFWDHRRSMVRCRACWRDYVNNHRKSGKTRLTPAEVALRNDHKRAYRREWAARKRRYEREAEGRGRYERRKVA